MKTRNIYWHLPGLCYFRYMNVVLADLMEEFPEKFRDGYKIGSVYGTFPGAIWNGGRFVFGIVSKTDMGKVIKAYNDRKIPVRFTWTNTLIEEKHLQDTYCNLIMQMADNGMNHVLVNRPILEEYIRKNYPSYKIISSTTKRMIDSEALVNELKKDYDLVVLDYDLNRDESVLKMIEPYADRIEILTNEICYPNCQRRAAHYEDQSKIQLEFDIKTDFQCPNTTTKPSFAESMKRPAFISNEELQNYIERGFANFKIVGRGLPEEFVRDSYLYFLVKDEAREFIKNKMNDVLSRIPRR